MQKKRERERLREGKDLSHKMAISKRIMIKQRTTYTASLWGREGAKDGRWELLTFLFYLTASSNAAC